MVENCVDVMVHNLAGAVSSIAVVFGNSGSRQCKRLMRHIMQKCLQISRPENNERAN